MVPRNQTHLSEKLEGIECWDVVNLEGEGTIECLARLQTENTWASADSLQRESLTDRRDFVFH